MWFSLYKQLYSVSEDLDKVNILPLHHTHNGQPCPISLKNKKKIDTFQDQILQIEQNEKSKIHETRSNLDNAIKHYQKVKHDYDTLQSPTLERADLTNKIHTIDQNLHNLIAQLNSLPKIPNYEGQIHDIKHKILALQHKQRELHDHHTASPLTMELENQIAVVRKSSKHDIDNINQRIGQLRDLISKLGEKPKRPQDDILDKISASINDGISKVEQEYKQQSSLLNKKYNDAKLQLQSKQQQHSRRNDQLVDDIHRLESQLVHYTNIYNEARDRAAKLPKTVDFRNEKWEQTRIAAEGEIENIKTKIALFKKASDQELRDLDHKNNVVLEGLRKEYDVNKANEGLALRELKNRISHDRANTSVEVTYGTQQSIPFAAYVVEPRPEVVIQATEVLVPTLVPKTAMVNTTENIYYRDRDLSDKPYHSKVEYQEYPDIIQRDIIHDTSIPKVTVELKKRVHETKKETVVATPVTKKIIEEVVQEQVEVKPVKIKVTYQDLVSDNVRDVTTRNVQTSSSTSGSTSSSSSSTSSSSSSFQQPVTKSHHTHTTIVTDGHGNIKTHVKKPQEKTWGDVMNPLKWFT